MFPVQIAFIADIQFFYGALVTIGSALRRISPYKSVVLHGMVSSWRADQVAYFQSAVKRWHPRCDLRIHEFDEEQVAALHRVRGSLMNYALFFLPSQLEGIILYLDCDLLVRLDLSPLFDLDLGKAIAAAVTWETLANSADKTLFLELGIPLTSPHFNCGVMLIDCEQWRNYEVGVKSLALRQKYDNLLVGGNQPVLNAVLHGRICSLPRVYNTLVSPHRSLNLEMRKEERVWHLVGRPKPWEFLGRVLHCLGRDYSKEEQDLGLDRYISSRGVFRDMIAAFRHWRGYYRCIRSAIGL